METPCVVVSGSEVDRAAGVLARAMVREPLMVHAFPDIDARVRVAPVHFAAVVRLCQERGTVWRTTAFDAVACWLGPGAWPPGAHSLERSGMAQLPTDFGPVAWKRFSSVFLVMDRLHAAVLDEDHWDLMVVGVEPTATSRGLGSQVIAVGTDRADRAGLPCYLETMDERTVRLYQRHGFAVVAEERHEPGGPTVRAMVRAPQRSPASG